MADPPDDPPRQSDPDPSIGTRSSPWWLRAAAFVVVLVVTGGAVAVVLARQSGRAERASSAASTVQTVPVPADILGTTTSAAPRPLPAAGTTVLRGRAAPSTDQLATALEVALPIETGWTHAVSCEPFGALVAGEVIECRARTEPPIREVPPSYVLAVVLDDEGRFTWVRGTEGPVTIAALQEESLRCADLRDRGFGYVSALAWWTLWGRPVELDPDGDGRPCTDVYPADEVAGTFAKARPA
jgi:hypothetical protein